MHFFFFGVSSSFFFADVSLCVVVRGIMLYVGVKCFCVCFSVIFHLWSGACSKPHHFLFFSGFASKVSFLCVSLRGCWKSRWVVTHKKV